MKKNILITGGCGYIGQTIVSKLIEENYNVIIIDSLINASKEAIHTQSKFYQVDIRDKKKIDEIFKENKIDLVVDFAALIDVEESASEIQEYYEVNVLGLLNILENMKKYNVKKIIFSSTAAVYETSKEKVSEEDLINPQSVYGQTKLIGENILKSYNQMYEIDYIIFRYFNVVGGKKIGYEWSRFSSIVPQILNSLETKSAFVINGDNYDTKDGTAIRDYIHIDDLVQAHIISIANFNNIKNNIYNLGIGEGTTILELIQAIEKSFKANLNKKIGVNRLNDISYSVANPSKFNEKLKWEVKYKNISEIATKLYEENKDNI